MNNNFKENKRLRRERITIDKMIRYYCEKNHGTTANLCIECSGFLKYAEARLINCPFGEEKPVCSFCIVHCYSHVMREKVKNVMRFSGPRMLLKHPYLAVMHMLDEKFYKPLMLRSKAG